MKIKVNYPNTERVVYLSEDKAREQGFTHGIFSYRAVNRLVNVKVRIIRKEG